MSSSLPAPNPTYFADQPHLKTNPPTKSAFPPFEQPYPDYKMAHNQAFFTPPPSTSRPRQSHFHTSDPIAFQLLLESALEDRSDYALLSLEEVEDLKREDALLTSRLSALRRALALETKIRDAAVSFGRLHKTNWSSSKEPNGNHATETGGAEVDNDIAASTQKCMHMGKELEQLEAQSQQLQARLSRHTAGVLQTAFSNTNPGHAGFGEDIRRPESPLSLDDRLFDMDERDMNDLLNDLRLDKSASKTTVRRQGRADPAVLDRTQGLNRRVVNMISAVNPAKGAELRTILPEANAQGDELLVSQQLDVLTQAIDILDVEQSQLQLGHQDLRDNVVGRLRVVNAQLSDVLESASSAEMPPIPSEEQGPFHQIDYTQRRVENLHEVLRQLNETAATSKHAVGSETAMRNLWTLLIAEEEAARRHKLQTRVRSQARRSVGGAGHGDEESDDDNDDGMHQDFSVDVFSNKLQKMIYKSDHARNRQDELHRRIQTQEDMLSRSIDPETDPSTLRMREDLERANQLHLKAEQVLQDQERQLAERDEHIKKMHADLEMAIEQAHSDHRTAQESLRAQISEATSSSGKMRQEMGNLESEVVRLTTELTFAKADLDAAYGSRSQRAADINAAAAARLEETTKRENELRQELQGTLQEFEELTRAGVEAEREREQLEVKVDKLRTQVETLETQLAEEKVNWMGVLKNSSQPGGVPATPGMMFGQTTGTSVLRTEFKKLMRDTRTEHLKALRAEQEERKKLEMQLRALRKGSGHVPSTLSKSMTS